tara:strand:- start:65 stop:286 length:222 start_codon:yes stop_codon:yes gene_type:complete
LLSKYFSNAKENKNRENTEISKDGIKVNNEKKIIYFLFAIDPLTLILFLIEFLTSIKIMKKNNSKRQIFDNNK